jgi:hypothetical protein
MTYSPREVTVEMYARPLLEALGTYFSHFSSESEVYATLCEAIVSAFQEPWTILEQQRTLANVDDAPLVSRRPLYRLAAKESESTRDSSNRRRVLLPDGITGAAFVTDKPLAETVILTEGVNFDSVEWSGDNWLVFTSDPFTNGDFETSSILDADNEVADTEVVLWLRMVETDVLPAESQWGTQFRMTIRTEADRKAVSQLTTAFSTGPSFSAMVIGAGRAFGHPVCEKHGEVVEDIAVTRRGQLVVTDQSAYLFPDEAEIIVSIGDTLSLCQPISSAVTFYDTTRNVVPDLPGWAVSNKELGSNYEGSLVFVNEERDVIVTSTADRTKINVELGGSLADQETFWSEVHTRGMAGERTLANYLDTRPNPVGEPTSADLPATLNTYNLLFSESFIYAAAIAVLDFSQNLAYNGAAFMAAWRKALPSHQTIMSYCLMSASSYMYSAAIGGEPSAGMVMLVEGGYYGIGPYSSAGGQPVIAQGT